MSFVVDCSVSIGWFLPAQRTPYVDAVVGYLGKVAGAHAWAPGLWGVEIANVLRTACKRQKLDALRAQMILAEIMELPIRIDENPARAGEVLALALRHDLSAYDAIYLDLALRLKLPIATRDENLCAAARASGVGVWQPAPE